MKSLALSILMFFLGLSLASAQTTVTVGPTGTYASPCVAFQHLADGDTVKIDANGGTPYTDTSDCTVKNNNLTIVGVNGRPILDATNAGIGKALWVIDGHDVVIDNLEFRGVTNPGSSSNAEAIRIEPGYIVGGGSADGGNVTVQHCYIHNNNEGILSDSAGTDVGNQWYSANPYITFQYDEFAYNGFGDGFTHNMYMGASGNMDFTLQYSWSHDAFIGNVVKDRGPINNILYNLISDSIGASSYILDFPLGGSTYIVGNVLYKAAVTNPNANENMIMWRDMNDEGSGSDAGYGTTNQDLHVINNTVIDVAAQAGFSNFFNEECTDSTVAACGTPTYGPPLTIPGVFENNIFMGESAQITNDTNALVEDNVTYANTAVTSSALNALFVDAAHFDYHLVSGSAAIQAGLYPPTNNAGVTDPAALAKYEYVIPVGNVTRPTPSGSHMDAGAYSYPRVGTPPTLSLSYTTSVTVPGTGTITVSGLPTPPAGQFNYVSFISGNTSAIADINSVATSTSSATVTFQTLVVNSTTVVPIDVYANGAHATANVTVSPGAPVLSALTIDGNYYPQSTVHLYGPSSSPVVINLSSSNPTVLYVPSSVTIPAGQSSAETGSINGSLWGQTPSSQNATLTATQGSVQKTLVINVAAPFIHNFYGPSTVVGGQVAGFALVMAGDYPPGGGPVYITSDTPAVIPNQTINLPEGNYNSNINVNTNVVTSNTNVNVTVNMNGSTSTQPITVTPGGAVPASIAVVSGSGQSSPVGTNFANPLVAVVKTSSGSPVSGVSVTFAGTNVSFPSGATAITNSSGQASVVAQPTATGSLTVTASVSGVGTPASFSETGTASTPASVTVVSGSGQSSPVGTNFTNPLVVVVKNSGGTGVSGVTVTYAGTNVSFPSGATAVTNSSGQASIVAQPTATGSLTVTASVSGVSTPASFSETGTAASSAISSITQDNSYQSGTTVHLTAAAPTGGAVVTLSSSNSSILYAPATVTVPAGQTSAETDTLLGGLWGQTPTSKPATLTATYNGTKTLTMNVDYVTIHAFAPNSTVVGGQALGFYFESAFNVAPVGGGPYTISSDHPSIIPTQNYTLAAGTANDFGKTINTNTVSTTTTVNVTLTYNGATATQAVSVTPGANSPASIAVVSGSGQTSPVGTNFTNPLVAVVKNSSGGAVSGATVTFAGTGVTFPSGATAVTNSSGQASVTAQPTATGSLTVTASVSGVGTPASFSETGTSSVAVSSITQDNNYQSGTTVHLTAAAPTGGTVVSLSTSNSSILYTPATVTVPAGQTSAETGTLLGGLWGQTPTSKSATLTAIAGGATKTLTMNVDYTTIHGFYPGSTVVGGQPLGFYFESAFNTAPVGGAPYTVSSDHPSIIPTQNYTLAAGQSNDFGRSLTTNTVTTSTTVNLTLTYNGATTTIPVTVTP